MNSRASTLEAGRRAGGTLTHSTVTEIRELTHKTYLYSTHFGVVSTIIKFQLTPLANSNSEHVFSLYITAKTRWPY